MKQCQLCGKGSQMGGHRNLLRGHYNPTPLTRKHPNLQYAKVNGARKLMCSSCMRSLSKPARAPRGKVKAENAAAAAAK